MNISREVQNFYNKIPFPDYDLDRFKKQEDLKILSYPFANVIDRSIPDNASVIDVGTGTGQLSALLSRRRKYVYGIDFSKSSLTKARKLKEKLNLKNWYLKQIDILDRKQIKTINSKFNYLLCLGVLHHTENPYQGFQNIISLLLPGGYIAVGLYNKFGRIPLKVRQSLTKTVFLKNDRVKDWFIKIQIGEIQDKVRARGWWNDQYQHPHESTHTVGEVLRWFEKNNIEFLHSVPSTTLFLDPNHSISGAWNNYKEKKPNMPVRMVKQLSWIWKTHQEGGYFIVFGKKRK